MSRLDELPADQKATLQLLLKQGKSYEDLAGLLRLEPRAVRDRALNALDALGPETVDGLSPERQDEVSDYLLGQQSASARAGTRSFLEGSAAGRAWARAVAAELRPFAGDALPEIPADAAEVEEAFDAVTARAAARERQEQSSRLGGILLLLGVAAIVAVVVVIAVSRLGGDDDNSGSADSPAATQADTTASTGTGTGTSTDPNGGIELQIPMTSTSNPNVIAAGFILNNKGTRVLGINGQDFAPTDGSKFNYCVWLYTSPTKSVRLGFVGAGVAATGADKGRLVTGADPDQIEQAAKASKNAKEKEAGLATASLIRAALKDVYSYKELIITREPANTDPKKPGTIVVAGQIVKPKS
jgi:hypothetical protein